jgi:hypothetical protein
LTFGVVLAVLLAAGGDALSRLAALNESAETALTKDFVKTDLAYTALVYARADATRLHRRR